jgi:hypothetical protein
MKESRKRRAGERKREELGKLLARKAEKIKEDKEKKNPSVKREMWRRQKRRRHREKSRRRGRDCRSALPEKITATCRQRGKNHRLSADKEVVVSQNHLNAQRTKRRASALRQRPPTCLNSLVIFMGRRALQAHISESPSCCGMPYSRS